ncbi:hypothetical protein [Chryseobacterium binzhouense]|uniref:hypothetical protein n=1 Tax=Chryseobacterium binzhouense TaxID=2593646 RepID=UPI00289A3C88|nr:hypothetical protein [Chryseobacterium binzhouense]
MKEIEFKGTKGKFKKLTSNYKNYEISKNIQYVLRVERITYNQTIIFKSKNKKTDLTDQEIKTLKTLVELYK